MRIKVKKIVDQRVTQIVNGVRGVHAVLPYGRIWKTAGVEEKG